MILTPRHPRTWATAIFLCLLAAQRVRCEGPAHPIAIDPQQRFLAAAMDFLAQEDIDPKTVDVELGSLTDTAAPSPASWKALAKVFVDAGPHGGYVRKLIFEKSYWMSPLQPDQQQPHRWKKLMWHEAHHLKFLPKNLQRSRELKDVFSPKRGVNLRDWENQWVELLEPLEELAAERECLERYRAAFGPVPEELMEDSRADMRKYAARYQQVLAALLVNARRPERIKKSFPAQLPIDEQGNIL